MDYRNKLNIELARLKNTDHLRTKLPIKEKCGFEVKLDGRRYTLQLGPSGLFVVSRSRALKTHGVSVSKNLPFVVQEPYDWMKECVLPYDVVLDGEFCSLGGTSASDAGRLDKEKELVCFDILIFNGSPDIQSCSLSHRRDVLARVIKEVNHPRVRLHPQEVVDEFTEPMLDSALESIPLIEVEGFVLKPLSRPYGKHTMGWKIKVKDTSDGFIVAVAEEKKHNLGEVTKTGRVGTVGVAQWEGKKSKLVAWIPLPEEDRHPIGYDYMNRVVEFVHLGWDGKKFRFPQFKQWRTDKSADQCLWQIEE
jgi:ATP-dependent DNA ligase